MQKIILVVLVMLLCSSLSNAQELQFGWMEVPGQFTRLKSERFQNGINVDIINLAENLEIPYTVGRHNNRIRLDLPAGRLIFTKGLPFVLVEGQLKQMPLPLSAASESYFVPLEQFVEFLAEYYPGDLFYDPVHQRILAAKPSMDILGLRLVQESGVTRAVITATHSLKCKSDETGNGATLIFPHSRLDTSRFDVGELIGAITSIQPEQTEKEARIRITVEEGASFSTLEILDDPPMFIANFTHEKEFKPDQEVTQRLQDEKDQWEFDVVVIDAGHGGKDPGAVGPSKLYEKQVTLDVALKLKRALENKGIQTVMTRSKDEFVTLAERTRIANNSGGKLFVSLHCNSHTDRRAKGMETYFMSPTKTERAMKVALLENSVIKYEESQEQYRDLTEENFILLSMAQANFVKESQDLAAVVQEKVSTGVGMRDRGVDQAGFYVLIGASMPAVLFEMGFISNKKEEKLLSDKNFRQKLADHISKAVLDFLEDSREGS